MSWDRFGLLLHQHKAPKEVKRIFEKVEGRSERIELNLYIVGEDETQVDAPAEAPRGSGAASDTESES